MSTEPLVTTEWVEAHLADPDVVVAEVDEDTTLYDTDHIPGAIALHWQADLHDPVRRALIDAESFAALMDRNGITNDTHVVLYGGNYNWFAAFTFWCLRLYGHERVSLMDGGRKLWELESRPLTSTEATRRSAQGYEATGPDPGLRILRDELLDRFVGAPDGTALVDARSPEEYRGEIITPQRLPLEAAQVPGHIPGAVNIPSVEVLEDESGRFRPRDELRELYAAHGVRGEDEVVTYSRVGESSAHSWFVLHELLGFERVRNYDGSWTEYGSLVDVPVARADLDDDTGRNRAA